MTTAAAAAYNNIVVGRQRGQNTKNRRFELSSLNMYMLWQNIYSYGYVNIHSKSPKNPLDNDYAGIVAAFVIACIFLRVLALLCVTYYSHWHTDSNSRLVQCSVAYTSSAKDEDDDVTKGGVEKILKIASLAGITVNWVARESTEDRNRKPERTSEWVSERRNPRSVVTHMEYTITVCAI